MFHAAKTLEDEHVGILFDRIGSKDDTNLQSLLGRACGYGKSKRTYIFTSQQTVVNYISCWKELCSKKGFPPQIRDIPVKNINKRMPRVAAFRQDRSTHLYSTGRCSLASAGGAGPDENTPRPMPRAVANEDHFTSQWREFDSFDEARSWAPGIRPKQMDDYGFYLSSTTGAATILSYDQVMGMKAGKKTANMPWRTIAPNARVDRLYIAYRDLEDPSTAVFIVRRLTRNI
jgi:hypothetical protein